MKNLQQKIDNCSFPPFAAMFKDNEGKWTGADNLTFDPGSGLNGFKGAQNIIVKDKDDAFQRVIDFKNSSNGYKCGYVADYKMRILYYDTDEVIEHLIEKGINDFFFVKMRVGFTG